MFVWSSDLRPNIGDIRSALFWGDPNVLSSHTLFVCRLQRSHDLGIICILDTLGVEQGSKLFFVFFVLMFLF